MRRRLLLLATLFVLLPAFLTTESTQVRAATAFVVDVSFDDAHAHDATPGDCVCADTYTQCTLRAAIEEANACSGIDTIIFSKRMTIDVSVGSYSLTAPVIIDASGVWDTAADAPGVTINGGGGSFAGLYVGGGSCQIYGLYITGFDGSGIFVASAGNQIGGTAAGMRNVLSGNSTGITLTGAADNNGIYNNYIGLAPEGISRNPNGTGIVITAGAADNIIGGTTAAQANYISGNVDNGVTIEGVGSDRNWIGGNAIGVATDLSDLGNGRYGIYIQGGAAQTVIGGGNDSGNTISYNGSGGVYLSSAGGGTGISDNLISGNPGDGIHVGNSSGCSVQDNLISNNGYDGVRVYGAASERNLIRRNGIWGNGGLGIHLQDGGNLGLAAPVIDSAGNNGASGTACGSCSVSLYCGQDEEGRLPQGTALADANGNWSYAGLLIGPNVTATAIDADGNTSEFSAAYVIGSALYYAFVPLLAGG